MLVQRMKSLVNDFISEEGNESEDEDVIATKGSNTTTTSFFPSFFRSLDYKRLRFPFYSQSISEVLTSSSRAPSSLLRSKLSRARNKRMSAKLHQQRQKQLEDEGKQASSLAASPGDISENDCDSESARVLNNNNTPGKQLLHPDEPNGYLKKSRRTNSVDRVTEIQDKELKERNQQPDRPCHSPQDSLLSSSSGYTNYRGVLNLVIILLVLSNARVALENIIKYGILVDPFSWFKFLADPTTVPSLQILFGLNIFILNAFWIEKYLMATGILSEFSGKILITLNSAGIIVIPAWVVITTDCHVVGSTFALFATSVTFLKIVSYHMVNFWCRRDGRRKFSSLSLSVNKLGKKINRHRSLNRVTSGSESNLRSLLGSSPSSSDNEEMRLVQYPENLNIPDMYYFIFVPTLCYELNFPRSQRIRKRFLIRRCIEMVFLLQIMLGLVQQWIFPTIFNSIGPLTQMNYPKMFERLLKLAIPNHIIWLIAFYWMFHSCLNICAEILRFADREFYRDWWNSCSVQYFWANWNIPVHKWCLRHLYKPLLSYGWTKMQASTAVFFVSAFFHEYLVSVPLNMFRIWAFSGMLFQIPFAMIVARFHKYPQWANTAVWVSIIIGQPLCILMYYHDYFVSYLDSQGIQSPSTVK